MPKMPRHWIAQQPEVHNAGKQAREEAKKAWADHNNPTEAEIVSAMEAERLAKAAAILAWEKKQ